MTELKVMQITSVKNKFLFYYARATTTTGLCAWDLASVPVVV